MPTHIATTILSVIPTPTSTSALLFKPQSGVWVGRGVFLNNAGEERNLYCIFTVSEDGNQFESSFCAYILGPFEEGKNYEGLASATDVIINNKFSMHLLNLDKRMFILRI
jgi:hypothetical protein